MPLLSNLYYWIDIEQNCDFLKYIRKGSENLEVTGQENTVRH